ncbi:MAG: ATP-binding cassette domain-containing protein, partial [Planctomycetaceae bacterium]|nr:ATP-binding cassette domain-containing protein [Planctomycetaceae bacterium]
MLELDNINKQYQRRGSTVHALRDTSLTVETGEYVALIGPSGSGKTTMLSILGGMLAPTQGRVMLEGQSLYDLS